MKRSYFSRLIGSVAIAVCCIIPALAADSSPQVVLNTTKTGPRTMEELTEKALLRDYKFAWASLEQAMESNSTAPLNALFAGTASKWLNDAITSQQKSGVTSRYLNQNHKVEAVFYSPEGDVVEMHDTADYDLQVLEGSKSIHNEHVTVRYVVLMTPGADRWVIRQLQSVPQF